MRIEKGVLTYRAKGFQKTITFPIGQPINFPGVLTVDARTESTHNGERIRVSLVPQHSLEVVEIYLEAVRPFAATDQIFCNGFQSWSQSREYSISEHLAPLARTTHIYKMQFYGEAHFINNLAETYPLHSHTYSYIRGADNMLDFVGSLSEVSGYTLIHYDPPNELVRIQKECQGLIVTEYYQLFDLFFIRDIEETVFETYRQIIKPQFRSSPVWTGWSSRNYTGKLTAKAIGEILEGYRKHQFPIDIIHIHDGYQNRLGDWLDIGRAFPQKMAPVAEQIREYGYRAGIWLAPFICEKKSKIYKQHNTWLARNPDGSPVIAGASIKWGGNFYALDLQNNEVRDYLRHVLDTVMNQWGFEVLWVDYLYAAGIIPQAGMTRAQILAEALRFLRECAGQHTLIPSCVPLGVAWDHFDHCRVSAEITPKWEDWLLARGNFRERRSTINALISLIGRRQLNNRLFANVADLFCVESGTHQLSPDQQYTLCLINNLFSSLVLTSDNISRYSSSEMRQYGSIFPLRTKQIQHMQCKDDLSIINFAIDQLEYLAYTNLSDHRRMVQLPKGDYFWRNPFNDNFNFIAGKTHVLLPPHASRCYLKIRKSAWGIAGGTAHLFPGSEIVEITQANDQIQVTQDKRVIKENTVFIQTPEKKTYPVNGVPIEAWEYLDQLFVVQVHLP